MKVEDAIEVVKEIQETNRAWLKETKEEICEKIYLKDIEAIDTVLNELEEQTESNKELNKVLIHFKAIINEMANSLIGIGLYDIKVGQKFCFNEEEVKEYFYKKVGNKNEIK